MFEATGVFTTACDMWCVKPVANQTLIEFWQHFTNENKECLCKLMAAQLGYHGTNMASEINQLSISKKTPKHSSNAAISTCPMPMTVPTLHNPTTATPHIITDDGMQMFYCWTHGLGFNRTHTSTTCINPADGHCLTATATNMQVGKNIIQTCEYHHRTKAKN